MNPSGGFTPDLDWRIGCAHGHFGEFLQGRLGADGPICLITLPCPVLEARAMFRPGGRFACALGPSAPLSTIAARNLVRALTGREAAGRLVLRWTMPAGGGAGASTASLVAAARAIATGRDLSPLSAGDLAAVCLSIEGATDPLMFAAPATLLWAPRAARILDRLPAPPLLEVVGGFEGAPLRTDPTDRRFADVSDLIALWTAAVARGDLPAVAALATTSAQRNQDLRGGPPLTPLLTVARETGALGLVAAHTGSARGLLFAPRQGRPDAAAARLTELGLRSVLRFRLADRARDD